MDAYVTEEQQVEALKNWWKKNGSAVLSVAAIGAVLAFGVKYYLHHQNVITEEASMSYNTMLKGVQESDQATIVKQAQSLKEKYSNTTYAAMASLFLARQAVEADKLDEAIMHLTWCVENSKVNEIKLIAQGRLARVIAAKGELEKAIAVLEKSGDKNGYLSLMQELKGDFLADENKIEEARASYALAIKTLGGEEKRPILKLKLDDLEKAASNKVEKEA